MEKARDPSVQPPRAAAAIPQIPQPGGWGSFTLAYSTAAGALPEIPQPEGWGCFIPTYGLRVKLELKNCAGAGAGCYVA
jgi:hypothetical protein